MGGMAESSGNGPQRPGQARLADSYMAKTVALVVVALIVGIVLINIVDDGGSTAKTSSNTTPTTTSTGTTPTSTKTPTTSKRATTTTTKKSTALLTPASIQLLVVNSGAPKGSGSNILNALKARGYTNSHNDTVKVTWSEAGLTVHCKPGLERERTAIVAALAGIPKYKASAAAFKTEPGVRSTDKCYVAIGAAA
jgi:hypothetical protein